jgi:hypothetical protein
MILKYIVSFGAQTLHNGTTHRGRSVAFAAPSSNPRLITLPTGVLFDPYGSNAAPKTPEKVVYNLLLVYSTDTLCSNQVDVLASLIGTKATLTGQKPNGVNVTCSARLTQINDASPANYGLNQRRLSLTFQPLGIFA